MSGFPAAAWVLAFFAVVPGLALAAWNAARGRNAARRGPGA